MRTPTETTTDPTLRRTWRFTPRLRATEKPLAGPWDDEEDKIQWVDAASDLDCLMLRNHHGAWCGYVGVPQAHSLYGVGYDDCRTCDGESCYTDDTPHVRPGSLVDVHGGLTFADLCTPGEPIDGICHIAQNGREAKPWWFGFDCGHHMDLVPTLADYDFTGLPRYAPVYRTEGWVTDEVTNLAGQLVKYA